MNTTSQIFTVIGLLFDIIGVIILFFNGLPFNPDILESYVQISIRQDQISRISRQKKYAWVALILITLGFICQLVGALKIF